jgi:hypothetical protein
MSQEFIIMDATVARINARNPLEEGLFLADYNETNETWCKNHPDAKKYATVEEAINIAKKLEQRPSKKPRIFTIQQNGPNMNITEFHYS